TSQLTYCLQTIHYSTGDEFINVSKSVGVTYSSGEWSGYLVKGKVGLGDLSMVEGVFALITSSDKFFIERADWAGILGLAYRSLAKPEPGVGTVWDSVRETNGLQDVFTMQLCPPRESTLFPGTFVRQGGYMVRCVHGVLYIKQRVYMVWCFETLWFYGNTVW
ncbi:Beta-secretase 1, partial [Geodia barretti]